MQTYRPTLFKSKHFQDALCICGLTFFYLFLYYVYSLLQLMDIFSNEYFIVSVWGAKNYSRWKCFISSQVKLNKVNLIARQIWRILDFEKCSADDRILGSGAQPRQKLNTCFVIANDAFNLAHRPNVCNACKMALTFFSSQVPRQMERETEAKISSDVLAFSRNF